MGNNMKVVPLKSDTEVEIVESPLERFDSRRVVENLSGLMSKVTEKDCTPDTVNAACNCAGRITDILRLHLEAERMKRRRP